MRTFCWEPGCSWPPELVLEMMRVLSMYSCRHSMLPFSRSSTRHDCMLTCEYRLTLVAPVPFPFCKVAM